MQKIQKVANGKCREYVRNRKQFMGNNIIGVVRSVALTDETLYVVFSYGEHFPLFIYHYGTDTWFENEDRYSVTTSKHRSQAHPLPLTPTKKVSTGFMKTMLWKGLVATVGNVSEAA